MSDPTEGRPTSGEEPDVDDVEESGASKDDELATDPETGSTPTDPSVDDTGPPPAGDDPMGGPAPSG